MVAPDPDPPGPPDLPGPPPDPLLAPDDPGTAPQAPVVPGTALQAPRELGAPRGLDGLGRPVGPPGGSAGVLEVVGVVGVVGGFPTVFAAEAKRSSRESAATEGPVSPLASSYNCRHQSSS
ncbi:hypothetical protein ABT147_04645 [Streptomyces sp. NPDC001868]|uniref:hypothetical protein n=1 Tax=Streptomyces sp. NPDC001868 TaxID=3154401 RepID=UPI00331B0699